MEESLKSIFSHVLKTELMPLIRQAVAEEFDKRTDNSPFVNVAEVAEIYGVTTQTIRKKIAEGFFEKVNKVGKNYLIDRKEVVAKI